MDHKQLYASMTTHVVAQIAAGTQRTPWHPLAGSVDTLTVVAYRGRNHLVVILGADKREVSVVSE